MVSSSEERIPVTLTLRKDYMDTLDKIAEGDASSRSDLFERIIGAFLTRARAKDRCVYCGSTWHPEEDHQRPTSRNRSLIVLACRACNRSMGDKTLSEWLDWLAAGHDPYRWRRIREFQKYKRTPFADMVRRRR